MTNKDKKFFDSIRDKLTTNTDKIKSKLIELKNLLANDYFFKLQISMYF